MGDRNDEVSYWNIPDKAQEYAEILSSDEFSNSPYGEYMNQSADDEESVSKRFELSPVNHLEGDVDGTFAQSSPLGLTLRKTPSFLNLLENSLSKGKQALDIPTQSHQDSTHDHMHKTKLKMDDLGSQSMEKLKASNFPVLFVKIGDWQRISRHEGDLVAKLYYAKHKMVWEVLEGALKSKIEIQWSDIIAIKAHLQENEAGTLEIELNQPPLFYRETNPQPRKHTLWQQASDFTGDQASLFRRHYVKFPPGILDKHYEKLLQNDQRLLSLSLKPFPSHESPFFSSNIFRVSPFSLTFNGYGSNFRPTEQYSNYTISPTMSRGASLGFPPQYRISVMDLSYRNEEGLNNQQNLNLGVWETQGESLISQDYQSDGHHLPGNYQVLSPNEGISQDYQSDGHHFLGNSQVVSPNEGISQDYQSDGHNFPGNFQVVSSNEGTLVENYQSTYFDQVVDRTTTNNVRIGYIYPESWLSSQDYNDPMVEEPTISSSILPYPPNNPTHRDYF